MIKVLVVGIFLLTGCGWSSKTDIVETILLYLQYLLRKQEALFVFQSSIESSI